MNTAKRTALLWLAGIIWIAFIGAGLCRLLDYENTPATVAVDMSSRWPRNSTLLQDKTRYLVVMTVHPHCPCTRASIAELARVMAVCPDQTEAIVLFTVPQGMPAGWEKTDLWRSAAAIPGVRVLRDKVGTEAARFGATVSGQCFCFAPSGRRIFSGGITASRGHEGDNANKDALIRALSGRSEQREEYKALVFGCALAAPAR